MELDKFRQLVDNKFNCLFVNARSLINNLKIEDLQMYAVDYNLHIVGIAETWLQENVSDEEIYLKGFTLCRKDRNSFKPGR